jgi:hypothetical protein
VVFLRQTGLSIDHGEIGNCMIEGVVAIRKYYDDYFAIALNFLSKNPKKAIKIVKVNYNCFS